MNDNMPFGLGGAIIQTPEAIGFYDELPLDQQWALLEGATGLRSHDEVLDYVRSWNNLNR